MWHRFDLLKYELPVDKTGIHVRIEVYARHTTSFPYDNLDFNMVLYTPSGEERIREFRLKIKDGSGAFSGSLSDGVYTVAVVTHKDLNISKEGNLKVELENLIPKLETPGLTGIGIRLTEL
jgi:gliding motility-associated lipoprotein GldH